MNHIKQFQANTKKSFLSFHSNLSFGQKKQESHSEESIQNDEELILAKHSLSFTSKKEKVLQQEEFQGEQPSFDSNSSRKSLEMGSKKYEETQIEMVEIPKSHSDTKVVDILETIVSPKYTTSFLGIELEEDCCFYREQKWEKMKFKITNDRLAFLSFSFPFEKIEKIKILPGWAEKAEKVIKLKQFGKNFFTSISSLKTHKGLPLVYYVFAKVILKKLGVEGALESQSWQKSYHSEQQVLVDSCIFGMIYKKSQHLKQWNERYLVIKKEGLYSYKDPNKNQNFSFFISKTSIKYIWTRFDYFENFLIIKVKHGLNKTEFGIPIKSFMENNSTNWLYEFYKLV